MSITKDKNGKESSKRKWATRFLSLGFAMVIIYFLLWGYVTVTEKELVDFPLDVWIGVMGFGSGISIATVFESR